MAVLWLEPEISYKLITTKNQINKGRSSDQNFVLYILTEGTLESLYLEIIVFSDVELDDRSSIW